MRRIITLFILSFIVSLYAIDEVNLKGFVLDTSNVAIPNANVLLKNNNLSTNTDDQGFFEIKQSATSLTKNITQKNSIKVSGKILQIHVSHNKPLTGSIRIFDLNGKVLLNQKQLFSSGYNTIDLSSKLKYNGYYVVQINFENGEKSNSILSINNSRAILAKTESTILDTLIVSKDNFEEKRIALYSLTDSLSINLSSIIAATITKHGAGSSSQSVAQGSSIIAFSFSYHDATGIKVEGAPEGLTITIDTTARSVSFSGKVTAAIGSYTYTLTTTGGKINATGQGTITVTEAISSSSVAPSSSSNQTLMADGYASVNGSTTGGGNATPVTVSTYAAFKEAVQSKDPKVVIVSGTIRTTDGDGYGLVIGSNKTIQGKDKNATIYGGIAITGATNVIVRNINIQGVYPNPGPSDALAVNKSNHVWIDHVNIWDGEDGNLDITNQSNYVTVSWCKFWYTDANHPHRLNALIGSGASDHPEDFNHLKVTYHHNWFSTLVHERMPRVMYGNAHIYNNYYNSPGNLYCIGVGSYASVLIENNYFKDVKSPHLFMYDVYANMVVRNNEYNNTTGNKDSGALGSRFITVEPYALYETPITLNTVPYTYTLDKATDIPTIVMKGAGPQF